jgi:hypothetical protein
MDGTEDSRVTVLKYSDYNYIYPDFQVGAARTEHVTLPIFTWLELKATDFVYPMHTALSVILKGKPLYIDIYSGAPGAAGATAPVAQTLRGQHGGNRLPFLPELHLEICALFTGIGI